MITNRERYIYQLRKIIQEEEMNVVTWLLLQLFSCLVLFCTFSQLT